MQQTFGMIKTHAYSSRWYIIDQIKRARLSPARVLSGDLLSGMAERLYAEHAGQPYWDDLLCSVSGPVVRLLIEGPDAVAAWRKLIGASDWRKAEPGTIRYALANRNGPMAENAVHGSDSEASARREIAIAFPPIGYSIAGGAPAPQPRRPGAMAEMA